MGEGRPAASTASVRVDLVGSDPAIWRRLVVAADLTLPHVFEAARTALGWSGMLLHFFRLPTPDGYGWEAYSPPYGVWDRAGHDETDVELAEVFSQVGDRIVLVVVDDYGDEWWHDLTYEGVGEPLDRDRRARLVDGEGACPPGDAGGIEGYNADVARWRADLAADRTSVWWSGTHDPDRFDVETVDDVLAHVIPDSRQSSTRGVDLSPVVEDLWRRCTDEGRTALDRLAAHLRPVHPSVPEDVAELVARWSGVVLDVRNGVITTTSRAPAASDEDSRQSLLEQAVRVGLVSRADGRLAATPAGRRGLVDPVALWRHLAEHMLTGRGGLADDADVAAALQIAAGREPSALLTERILTAAGHTESDEPLTPDAAVRAWVSLRRTLRYSGGRTDADGESRSTPAGVALCDLAVRRSGPRRTQG